MRNKGACSDSFMSLIFAGREIHDGRSTGGKRERGNQTKVTFLPFHTNNGNGSEWESEKKCWLVDNNNRRR